MSDARQHKASKVDRALEILTRRGREETGFATGRMSAEAHKGVDLEIDKVLKGVTVGWLAQAFDMNPVTVKQKLKDCPPISKRKVGGHIYSLKLAARYLLPPIFDVDQYLQTMKIEDLPIRMQKEYWDAKMKRMEWETEAGHLWRTEDVLEAFGGIFKTIKQSVQLWADDMEAKTQTTPDQRKFVRDKVDELQDKLFKEVTKYAKKHRTTSLLEEDKQLEIREQEEKARMMAVQESAKRAHEEEAADEDDYTRYI